MPGKPPHFPLYPNDLLGDGHVDAMTTEQFGAYVRLLCKAWFEEPAGTIPNDDAVLASWCRLSPAKWAKARPAVIKAFRKGNDGRYHQKRMMEEFAKLTKKLEARADAGSKGGKKRWQTDSFANGKTIDDHKQTLSDSDYDSDSSSSEEKPPGKKPGESPVGMLVRIWLHFAKGLAPGLREHGMLGEFFGELIRMGAKPEGIEAKIVDPKRRRSQSHWDFQKEFFPSAKIGGKKLPGSPGYFDELKDFAAGEPKQ